MLRPATLHMPPIALGPFPQLVYDFEEVEDSPFSIDDALALYDLQFYKARGPQLHAAHMCQNVEACNLLPLVHPAACFQACAATCLETAQHPPFLYAAVLGA